MAENVTWMDKFFVKESEEQIILNVEPDYLLSWHTGEHPFEVEDDADMQELMAKIARDGILTPLLVRRDKNFDGRYEVISGHRRLYCAKKLGLATVPVIVVDYDDEKATIAMVESNVGLREHIKPSNLAKAYKMYMDANKKRAGERTDLTSAHDEPRSWTANEAGERFKKSSATIKRYVRLTYLIPELLQMVDDEKLQIVAGVELSYLVMEKQMVLFEKMQRGYKMNQEEANRLRKLSDDEFREEMREKTQELNDPKLKKQKKPKLNETFINRYLTENIKKRTTEEKQQYVQQALIHYNNYLEEHPEEKAAWEDIEKESEEV